MTMESEDLKKQLNKGEKDCQDTTVIRISHKNYELLRQKAYYTRSTIRQIADDILEEELKDKHETK